MFNQIKRLLIGRPKKNRDLKNEKITKTARTAPSNTS